MIIGRGKVKPCRTVGHWDPSDKARWFDDRTTMPRTPTTPSRIYSYSDRPGPWLGGHVYLAGGAAGGAFTTTVVPLTNESAGLATIWSVA
jgi:hypothetical protein